MKPRQVNGRWKIPFQGDAILPAMLEAWMASLREAEDFAVELLYEFPDDLRRSQLVGVEVRVAGIEETLSPDYRFALVDVTGGPWIDGDGEPVMFGPTPGREDPAA